MIPVEIEHHALTLHTTWAWWAANTSSALAVLWAIYTWWVRPHRKTFKDKDVFLELDTANNALHIESGQDMRALTLKLGCGRFDFRSLDYFEEREKWRPGSSGSITVYGSGGIQTGTVTAPTEGRWVKVTKRISTGLTRITITELDPILYFYQKWADHPDAKWRSAEATIASLELRNRPARALRRWVHAHRHELIPSEKAYRKKWQQSCKHLLEECRQAPRVRKLKKPLEVFDYNATPNIRYLAIGKEGDVCLKTLDDSTFHELDFGQVQGEGSTLTITLSNGWKECYTLKEGEVSQFHQIQRHWQKHQARVKKHTQQVA